MSRARQILGRLGEDLACRESERAGCAILARRYRRRCGEVDIVARDGSTVVFVEVKARGGCQFGAGGEAVHQMKRRRMAEVALEFLVRHRLNESPCRFDVISVDVGNGRPRIEWYRNAFDVA